MIKRKCTSNIIGLDEFGVPIDKLICGVVIEDDTKFWCPEHEKIYQQNWDDSMVKNKEQNKKNPWHSVRECTRCGFEMPDAAALWDGDSYEENGIFQTCDGHGADVKISGGYDEFVDGTQQIAKLCKPCGFALLEFLNLDENGEKKHTHELEVFGAPCDCGTRHEYCNDCDWVESCEPEFIKGETDEN